MEKLDLETLESWLWESANILRGSIDSSDFKNYIFGLLFLKRFNDVFDEKVEKLMSEDGLTLEEAIEDIGESQSVPEDASWDNITKLTNSIGEALDKAFIAIEEHNSDLENVLTATQYGDKQKLDDSTLQRLLRHFNLHKLGNNALYKDDLLGDAYEYLIKMFADDAGKKGGEFYTPKGVVRTIVKLIDPKPGQLVYDPTCGSGGMLLESCKHIANQEGGKLFGRPNVAIFGQEKNLGTWAIAKLNAYLHNLKDPSILRGDTLTNPRHTTDTSLRTFDRVIANPPFSQKMWWQKAETNLEKKTDKDGKEKEIAPTYKKVVKDEFGRFQFGIPPRGYGDLAFFQHMLAVLKDDGKLGIVLPHGVLFRGGEEGKIREKLLTEKDWVEGIIGLPTALFYNTGISASIIIINKNKPEHLKNKIIFMDTSSDYKEGKNQNSLEEEHISKIVDSYQKGEEINKYMRIVGLSEIKENDFNLNITRYIDTSEPEEIVDIPKVQGRIKDLVIEEKEIDQKLDQFLSQLNNGVSNYGS